MNTHCRATLDLNIYHSRQAAIESDINMIRLERVKSDRELVSENAAKLLAKQTVKGLSAVWNGSVCLGSRELSWDYLDVVGRASESDKYFGHMIDLTATDFTTRLTAAKKLAEIVSDAADAIAFDSLDIGDIWDDVDELMGWELER